jgi:hypothetical protein
LSRHLAGRAPPACRSGVVKDIAKTTAKGAPDMDSHRLISADKVEGTTVYNRQGEKLGSIHNIMIDKYSGKVAYAEMSFGGFLGIGDRYHPLPWSVLGYDTDKEGYVVDLTKKALEGAPSYSAQDRINWEDELWAREVHDYYKVPPFWL